MLSVLPGKSRFLGHFGAAGRRLHHRRKARKSNGLVTLRAAGVSGVFRDLGKIRVNE
jgi:hypothetical protein